MLTNDQTEALDSIWSEIRQLVLNEGPATEAVDEMIADLPGFPDDDRETLIAQMIAFHCAQISRIGSGPFHGAPTCIILAEWARLEAMTTLRERGGEE